MSSKISMNDGLLDHFNAVEKKHWWWEGRRYLVKKLLTYEVVKTGGKLRILDLGCGTGETMTFMRKLFPKSEIYGIDNSPKAIKYTRSRGHKNAYLGDISSLGYGKSYFDIILILDVIEHIEDDSKVLIECKRVLKKGGKIIMTCPAMSWMWSKHDQEQGHKRRYNKQRMKYLEKVSGLKLTFLSYFNFLLAAPIIFIRLLSKIPLFEFLANYDNSFNYDIAFNERANNILTKVFIGEISYIKKVNYPFGISIAAVFEK